MITRNDRASRVRAATFLLALEGIANIMAQYSHLYRGVYPFLFNEEKPDFTKTPWQEDVDRRLKWGIKEAIALKVLQRGDPVVCVQGWRGGMGHTNTIRIVPGKYMLNSKMFGNKGGSQPSERSTASV